MVKPSVSVFLKTLDRDEAGDARAQIALALADKLDQAADPKAPVGLAAATAGLAKELRDTLAELQDLQGEAQAFVPELFTMPTSA